MVKHLLDLWILKDHGNTIFSEMENHNADDQYFGGLICALKSRNQFSPYY